MDRARLCPYVGVIPLELKGFHLHRGVPIPPGLITDLSRSSARCPR
ncbi:hypothetical protein STXM2123_5122 [Streptomyces sp. F-3]|nr:hypothetical protein STXM2123_5122 [Streptomyces sp. F-3]